MLLLLLFICFSFFARGGEILFSGFQAESVNMRVERAVPCCKFVELSKGPLQLKKLIVKHVLENTFVLQSISVRY